jgi:hypothetical protein
LTGIFPDRLKVLVVRPLYKNGDKSDMSNHRPVSLLTNNILVPEQFGFRKGISTENATFKLTYNVLKSLNQKMHVGGIFSDLAKAFGFINHEMLLPKLHYFSIQGATENWFRSYLTERKQNIETYLLKLGNSKYLSNSHNICR